MKIVSYILALIMLASAAAHIVSPENYVALIPDFFPKNVANILAAISETGIGLLLIVPKYRKIGGLVFMLLMLAFMPLHIMDALKEQPAIGSKNTAFMRIGIQIILIFLGCRIFKTTPPKLNS